MRNVFGWINKGAFVILFSVISSATYGVILSLGYIDGIAEWMARFSVMNTENLKYILTASSYIAFVFFLSLALSELGPKNWTTS